VVRIFASLPMAATIWSSGVMDGLVRYLCFNHTALDTHVVCVSFIQTFLALVVLEQRASDVSLVSMLCISLSLVWLDCTSNSILIGTNGCLL
jgi:hypothetical protein